VLYSSNGQLLLVNKAGAFRLGKSGVGTEMRC
jgi:hypothetical protein